MNKKKILTINNIIKIIIILGQNPCQNNFYNKYKYQELIINKLGFQQNVNSIK
ncbi:hypothetical protein pb186bvf_015835 [Paramecium bursaria]